MNWYEILLTVLGGALANVLAVFVVYLITTSKKGIGTPKKRKIYRDYCQKIEERFRLADFGRIELPTTESKISRIELTNIFVDVELKAISSYETEQQLINTFVSKSGENKGINYKDFLKDLSKAKTRRAVIIGNPGCGKSMLLRNIGFYIASGRASAISLEDNLLPIYVDCTVLSSLLKKNESYEFNINDFVKLNEFKSEALTNLYAFKLKRKKVFFLFDSFDEVPGHVDRNKVLEFVKEFITDPIISANYFLICSRTSMFKMNSFSGFDYYYSVLPFNKDKIDIVVKKFFAQLEDDSEVNEEMLNGFKQSILSFEIKKVIANPLFLMIVICLYYVNKQTPKTKVEVLSSYLISLLKKFIDKKQIDALSVETALLCLSSLAYKSFPDGFRFSIEDLAEIVKKNAETSPTKSSRIANELCGACGFIVPDSEQNELYTFSHKLFAEFLCANHLKHEITTCDPNEVERLIDSIISEKYKESSWDEIINQLFVLFVNSGKYSLACFLLESLSNVEQLNDIEYYGANYIIASQCVYNLNESSRLRLEEHNKKVYDEVFSNLDMLIKDEKCSIKNRINALIVLSLCDRNVDVLVLPEFVDVPKGTFKKGASFDETKRFYREIEKSRLQNKEAYYRYWRYTLASETKVNNNVTIEKKYRISKYPITNEQYFEFIKDNPEYPIPYSDVDDNSLDYSWNKATNKYYDRKRSYPVVLVTYEDAENYCQWLSKKTGRKFRLPTEDEWEYAARGKKSLIYSWGNTWEKFKCCTMELFDDLGKSIDDGLLPVGCFKDSSPFGAFDMCGLVWEWTSTPGNDEDNKYVSFVSRPDEGGEVRIVKGGTWDDVFAFSRCSARGPNKIQSKRYFIGFRIIEEIDE